MDKKPEEPIPPKMTGKRTDSPDNDSAFCDNLSVLSSWYQCYKALFSRR